MTGWRLAGCWLAFGLGAVSAFGLDVWPAETNTAAVRLTDVDTGLDTVNWSGASWNPDSRTLWIACNSGYFWALVENGAGGYMVATNAAGVKAKWSPGQRRFRGHLPDGLQHQPGLRHG